MPTLSVGPALSQISKREERGNRETVPTQGAGPALSQINKREERERANAQHLFNIGLTFC